jgi:hypothetical protein
MNDVVEIGVFTGGPPINTDLNLEFDDLGEVLHLQRQPIRSGRQTIRINVPQLPVRAGIDPYRRLIDHRGNDNVAGWKQPGPIPSEGDLHPRRSLLYERPGHGRSRLSIVDLSPLMDLSWERHEMALEIPIP